MMMCGRSAYDVGRQLRVSRGVVLRWWQRWRTERSVARRRGSGRPRKTTRRNDRALVLQAKRNRFEPVSRLHVCWSNTAGMNCSLRTAYRRLAEAGLRSYRPTVRIPLSPEHKRRRLTWCRDHENWSQERWQEVLWTDESRFCLDFHDGRIRVHRMAGERYAPCCISEHDRHGGGSVMIWAGIWYGGRTPALVIQGNLNAERYRDEIVLPVVVPITRENNLIFQDDNAKPHRAAAVRAAIDNSRIHTLPWPSRSPDLSPIEHAWDELGRRVRNGYPQPATSLTQLAARLREQWDLIDPNFLNNLCLSMPQRIHCCRVAKGGHTRY